MNCLVCGKETDKASGCCSEWCYDIADLEGPRRPANFIFPECGPNPRADEGMRDEPYDEHNKSG